MSRFERGLVLCLRSLLVLAFLAGCSQDDGTREKTALQRLVRPMMGTLVEVLWQPEGRPDDVSAARAAFFFLRGCPASLGRGSPRIGSTRSFTDRIQDHFPG